MIRESSILPTETACAWRALLILITKMKRPVKVTLGCLREILGDHLAGSVRAAGTTDERGFVDGESL